MRMARPASPQIRDDLLHVLHGDGIDAAERLVQHEQAGLGDERAGDGEAPLFAAGKREGELLGHVLDAELGEQFLAALPALLSVERLRLEDRHDVLLDRQFAEDRFLLRQIAHAHAGALVHGIAGHFLVLEKDASPIRAHEADDHVKAGGLARAVGAEQARRSRPRRQLISTPLTTARPP